MRIVVDTNVTVSAFLWGGTPRRILDEVEAKRIELFTSRALIAELEDVLSRGKFAAQLRRTRFTPAFLLARYTQLAMLLTPAEIAVSELRGCRREYSSRATPAIFRPMTQASTFQNTERFHHYSMNWR